MMSGLYLLSACTSLDLAFFDPLPLDAYVLDSAVIPSTQLQEVTFTSGDGVTLYGLWAWQADAEDSDTLVHFPSSRGNLDEHLGRIERYWLYGYNVFTFDYRGYGRSDGVPAHDGVLLDGEAAISAALGRAPGVRGPRDLWLHGTDLGGYVALRVSSLLSARALITEDTFSSLDNLIATNSGLSIPPGWLFEGDWDAQAAAASLDGVPLLIIHGDADRYILPEHARWLHASAAEPRALWLVPGGQSTITEEGVRHDELLPDEYAARFIGWLSE